MRWGQIVNRLIYHSPSSKTSPFDESAVQVARSGSIRIVSPYIGVGYLERLIAIADGWHLVTDVEAWLSSLSFHARPRAWRFIRNNLELIHHCPSIHAKLVLSECLAMFGSANLTRSGILGRTELGILLDDLAMVDELQVWFSALWDQTAPPIVDETSAFIQWLDKDTRQNPLLRQKAALSSETQKIRAKLAVLPPPEPVEDASNDAPLDLAAVVQAILVEEQKHYESLDQALSAMLDALAVPGFTLSEAIRVIQDGFPDGRYREIYFGVLRHTANHVRSVFGEDTINRLILTNGRFVQSTKDSISTALDRFDRFLSYLISHLTFDEPMELPGEGKIERETGMAGRDQVLLVSELLDSGLLQMEDLPGNLPLYFLDLDFKWEGRYKLFYRAHQAWIALERRPRAAQDKLDKVEAELDERRGYPRNSLTTWQVDDGEDDGIRRVENMFAAMEQRATRAKKEMLDIILANLLKKVLSGSKLTVARFNGLALQVEKETGFPKNIVKSILRGTYKDAPPVFQPIPMTSTDPEMFLQINPALEWYSMRGFPNAQAVCMEFLNALERDSVMRTEGVAPKSEETEGA